MVAYVWKLYMLFVITCICNYSRTDIIKVNIFAFATDCFRKISLQSVGQFFFQFFASFIYIKCRLERNLHETVCNQMQIN